jgi:leucyl-tRNA synthetase
MENNKFYSLVMFPYPSGDGLHVGHAYNYAVMDSYCRWKNHMGTQTFQPFGYDAFGLPAENYARKHNRDPREITEENIIKFRGQMQRMNTNYQELLVTSDPSYYKWSQWVFTKMVEHDMAYKKFSPVNYCPSCETAIANAEITDNKCGRCNTEVETREMNQWFFRLSRYADRLISNLDHIDFPEKTKKQQRNWLSKPQDWCISRQRKWGTPIPIDGEVDTMDTFVDSSFYFIRYCDPENDNVIADYDKIRQVDLYVGGNEHACMHLIYARFVNMFLYDIGVTPFEEPFKKLIHQGMIIKDGEKMSKSKGNVVNPDDYDPDELRMYLMFIGPYFEGGDWSDSSIVGVRRFIGRMRTWVNKAEESGQSIDTAKLTSDIDAYMTNFKFNKVVSTMMEFYNKNKNVVMDIDSANRIRGIFSCFATAFK